MITLYLAIYKGDVQRFKFDSVDSLFKKQQQLIKNVDRENMVKKSLKDLVVSELYLLGDGISIDMKKHNENKKELDKKLKPIG